jgi:hypothetical protein
MDLKGQVVDQTLQIFQAKTPPEWYFDLKQISELGMELRQVQRAFESSL